jgi:predicted nucleic acid-binding protein
MRSDPGAPRRLFVDSGAWLAFFSARDNHHAEADRLIRYALGHRLPLVTSDLVLAEVHRLLLFRAGIRPAAVALERIDASPGVSVHFADEGVHRDARAWLERLDDQVLTYTDATSFALMKAHGCTHALSFDHHFTVAGFTLWQPARRP